MTIKITTTLKRAKCRGLRLYLLGSEEISPGPQWRHKYDFVWATDEDAMWRLVAKADPGYGGDFVSGFDEINADNVHEHCDALTPFVCHSLRISLESMILNASTGGRK